MMMMIMMADEDGKISAATEEDAETTPDAGNTADTNEAPPDQDEHQPSLDTVSTTTNSSVGAATLDSTAGTATLDSTAGTQPEELRGLCRDMFEKMTLYLNGELSVVCDDYKLLESMNKVSAAKYAEMRGVAAGVSKAMVDLNEKYASLQPYLDQIDQIEDSVASLEQAAYRLDAYSKRLEAKFKQLEKR
ncbi:biogenesis of lysosome-related organelles complex 1 subunit 2-like isoform X2 [Branchiostoma floridae]|uniref:Biogenesis of lysosome-related organelles complex 1 subunit 2-like isoform X2 n=1 Tax=Branchiostoma floridae TaxID=7739 RepID=A0A9J7MJ98_BRAFL|nr:biogenesis of lysosome-related organelles complex 1 subunit 2-like isoform X2 [Branchiostoma floridae]